MRTAVSGRMAKGKGVCRETVTEERLKISNCKGNASTTEGFGKELYETKTKLLAKTEELENLRTSHDRRQKRIQALQASHKLLQDQLKTYETSTPGGWRDREKGRNVGRDLRHENSGTVWNELANYKEKCQELEWQLSLVQEERDTFKAKCLKSQNNMEELRERLEYEKNDLERKLSAIGKVEDMSNDTGGKSSELQLKVNELKEVIYELKHQKSAIASQHRAVEKECHQLRVDVAQMQDKIRSHNTKSQKSKKGSPYHVPRTDSSTQVNLSPLRPPVRDAQVSPFWPSSNSSLQTSTGGRPKKFIESYSEEKVTTRSHIRSVKKSPRGGPPGFRNTPEQSVVSESSSVEEEEEEGGSQVNRRHKSLTTTAEPLNSLSRPSVNLGCDSQQCTWQGQVRELQKKLKFASKELYTACTVRQSLSVSLEEERREKIKAKTEIRELTIRVQKMKSLVQSLQNEVQRMSAANEELQHKVASLAETKRGRQEADWKKLENEKRMLLDRCSSLNESVKSLKEKIHAKSIELQQTHDKYSRIERDLKQKRQLLDAHKDKMKRLTQQATEDKERVQSVQEMSEMLHQSRQKIETLRLQLSRETEGKVKLMEMLATCQEELAQTLQQLAASQEDCEVKKKLLLQSRQSNQTSQGDSSGQQRLRETVAMLEQQLRKKESFLTEHKQFIQELASAIKKHCLMVRERLPQPSEQRGGGGEKGDPMSKAVSSRVRNIAKSTLNFTDSDVDVFFSASHPEQSQNSDQICQLIGFIEERTAKLPFADCLLQRFKAALQLTD